MAAEAGGDGVVSILGDAQTDLDLSDIITGNELVEVGSSWPPPPDDLDWGEDETTQPYSVPALLAALEGSK